MGKLLRPKDKILLGLAFMGDLYFNIAEPISVQLGKLKGALPADYKITNFYKTFKRSLVAGEIEKVVKKGEAYFRLTDAGTNKIRRDFPLLKLQQQKWDGLWRIIIFDIKEKNKSTRDLLRYKLKNLGFGMWQESVYITPFNVAEDIREFLISDGLEKDVCIMIAKHLFAGNLKEMTSKIWNLKDLNEEYENIIDKWEEVKNKKYNNKDDLTNEAKRLYKDYLKIIIKDPFLPIELLPIDWQGNKVKALLKEWTNYF